MGKNILIIGAGAVGLVYGKHFVDGGHSVTFYIKEKYKKQMQEGTVLYHMNSDKKLKKPIRFNQYNLATSFTDLEETNWDEIYLCFSSTALQSFDFVELQKHLTGQPTIIMLQASTDDYPILTNVFQPEQIVNGMITLISYATPLATEKVDIPGTAYWIPPLMPMPISGEKHRRNEVIETYKSGNIKASASKSVQNDALFPSAFLPTFLTALEASDWNFQKLKSNSKLLKQLEATIGEVFTALETEFKVKRPFIFGIISKPFMIKLLLRMAPIVMPMDIETYFEYHFMKVKSQTKMYMKNYLLLAQKLNLESKNLQVFNQLT